VSARPPVRPFNPSNQPETCLYCGTKLKVTVFQGHSWSSTVSLCCQAPLATDHTMRWRDGKDHVMCSQCRRELVPDADDTETKTTVVPERRSEHAGYAGYFCTRDCGYRFGVLAAEKGVRYRRTEPAKKEASR